MPRAAILFLVLAIASSFSTPAAEPAKVFELWPGAVPGETNALGPERDMTTPKDRPVGGKPVIRLGDVSHPTLSVYRPAAGKEIGTAVMICPGGAYRILALDLEGTEVADWLNSLGVTAAVLKYRVPQRPGLEKYAAALQDAQRGLGLLREHAREFGIDPNRIGVMGFSAGGHLAAVLSSQYDPRTYPKVDEADATSCRPDFTMLIYPAYLTVKDRGERLSPELNLTTNTPPAFIALAQDDAIPVESTLFYATALRKARVPFELHVYPAGGHGYGLRPSQDPVCTWPQRASDWLRNRDLIK